MAGSHLTEEQVVEITLERFGPLEQGKREVPIGDLMVKWKLSKNAVTGAIRRAFSRRLVEVRRVAQETRQLSDPQRVERLETALKLQFPSLFEAIVVRTPETASDLVHRDLGYAMAFNLGTVIPHNATIGVGSGRGPYYTVTGLQLRPRLSRENITLMSLTGAVYPDGHGANLNVLLDADFHTGLLGVCFSRPLRAQTMVSYPIAPGNIKQARSRTWLDDKEFEKHIPTVAIVGVGVLKGRHRFHQAVKKNDPGVLQEIFTDLKKLVESSDQYSNTYYCPIADVCNQLFFVEPPQGIAIPPKARKSIIELVATINERLLTISEGQLAKVGGLLLVAGTIEKASAIRKLLDDSESEPPRVRVQVLCTDMATAEALLK